MSSRVIGPFYCGFFLLLGGPFLRQIVVCRAPFKARLSLGGLFPGGFFRGRLYAKGALIKLVYFEVRLVTLAASQVGPSFGVFFCAGVYPRRAPCLVGLLKAGLFSGGPI